MIARLAPIALLIACAVLSSGCTRTTAATGPAPAMAAIAPAPAAAGCTGAIAGFQRVIDADRDTGNVIASVHRRMSTDLAPAKTACAAGRDGEAMSQLSGVRAKYGYPEQRG